VMYSVGLKLLLLSSFLSLLMGSALQQAIG
jgi:hypothetical protein